MPRLTYIPSLQLLRGARGHLRCGPRASELLGRLARSARRSRQECGSAAGRSSGGPLRRPSARRAGRGDAGAPLARVGRRAGRARPLHQPGDDAPAHAAHVGPGRRRRGCRCRRPRHAEPGAAAVRRGRGARGPRPRRGRRRRARARWSRSRTGQADPRGGVGVGLHRRHVDARRMPGRPSRWPTALHDPRQVGAERDAVAVLRWTPAWLSSS